MQFISGLTSKMNVCYSVYRDHQLTSLWTFRKIVVTDAPFRFGREQVTEANTSQM